MSHRNLFFILSILLLVLMPGCENIDWNRDYGGWRRPRRVVRPDRSNQSDRPARSESKAVPEKPDDHLLAEDANPDERVAQEAASAPEANAPRRVSSVTRPYYRFYLLGAGTSQEKTRGEGQLNLRHIDPRSCARLLEMLYVPFGRSGSVSESYLIYEQREEFDAASTLAPKLDHPPGLIHSSSKQPTSSWSAGVSAYYYILQQGAIVDKKWVDECERSLAQAAQSADISLRERWAAAIMAGRLVSEYRYDYAAARTYYNHAARLADDRSIEQMTTQWWLADSYVQEGKTQKARATYQKLIRTFAYQWLKSQIIARSRAVLKDTPKN